MSALTPEQTKLVEGNLDLVRLAVNAVVNRTSRRADYHQYDDMASEASKALVEAAHRWPKYCLEKGYDPGEVEWFRIFATRRMKGAIIDMWRKDSPLTRTELDYSTYALRYGTASAAKKYQVPEATIQKALEARETLIVTEELPDSEEAIVPYSLWDILHRNIDSMPLIARVWLTLVFVHHVPAMEARKLLGLKDIPRATQLAGFVEYTLISVVLSEREPLANVV